MPKCEPKKSLIDAWCNKFFRMLANNPEASMQGYTIQEIEFRAWELVHYTLT